MSETRGPEVASREFGITWNWADAGRGALCAIPGAIVLLAVDVGLGICLALGAVVVAALGVPPIRSARPRLALVGVAFAVGYCTGSLLGLSEGAAIAALPLLAYAGVLVSVRNPAAKLLPALVLPAVALGMNHPAPAGLAFAAVLLAGALWATVVAYLWPEGRPPATAAREPGSTPQPAPARRAVRIYGVLFAAAAGIGLAFGYLLDLDRVAWAAAAAMFIMRPDPGLLASRAIGRTVATFAGVLAAGLILRHGPTEIGLAILTVSGVSAMVAVRTSRWYVVPAGSGFLVLLMSGVASRHTFDISFVERLLETAIGAALALTFGVAVPWALRRLARRRAVAPEPQASS